MSETVIIVNSKLKPGASRERFLELSRETKAWLHRQPGFLRYELYDGGGRWTDTMTWANAETADAGRHAFGATELARAFADLVEPDYLALVGKAVAL